MAHFEPELFEFLTELADNNRREWFKANKERYQQLVQQPMLAFISAFSEPLASISRTIMANPRPTGGSMLRVYRDVRFGKDKRPYKTNAGAFFRHRQGRDIHAPGFYLHLEPGEVFAAAGVWHPDRDALARFRAAIVDDPEAWTAAINDPDFVANHALAGDSLKRAPRGFDPEHPLINDLKRKDFVSVQPLSEEQTCRDDFLEVFTASCRAASPLMGFLAHALDLEW